MRRHHGEETAPLRRREQCEGACTNDKLIFKLRDLNHIMRSLYEGRGSQAHVLIVLLETGPVTQRDLTERLGIRPGSASEVIGKLEGAGLVRRTPSESDRRTADVVLTDLGAAKAREAAEQRARRHEEMFSPLSEEEKASLLALLEKLSRHWESRYRR